MTLPDVMSRRALLVKLGILFNACVGVLLAVPIIRYLISPLVAGQKTPYEKWLSLGPITQFPQGQTRFATFTNPDIHPWDGKTSDSACWVRRIDSDHLQVFAINCAHLGCPVRWFPQSGLFLCPCHGGAYYEDGSRASGPPERGLFQYPYKIQDGNLLIQAGELPTPGSPSASLLSKEKKLPCA